MRQVRVQRDGGEQAPPFALKHRRAAHQARVADGRSRTAAPGIDEEDQRPPAQRAPMEEEGRRTRRWPPEPAPVLALVDLEDGSCVDIMLLGDQQLPAFRIMERRGLDALAEQGDAPVHGLTFRPGADGEIRRVDLGTGLGCGWRGHSNLDVNLLQ